jgi:hypothetical protein
MEVADTEAAVTSVVEAISAEVTWAALTWPGVTSAEAVPMCTLVGPMCMLAEPASPEAATSGMTAAVGVAVIGVTADPMPPAATRMAEFIRTATIRNELKPNGRSERPFGVAALHRSSDMPNERPPSAETGTTGHARSFRRSLEAACVQGAAPKYASLIPASSARALASP